MRLVRIHVRTSWLLVMMMLSLSICMVGAGCSKRSKEPADQQQRAMETLNGRSWYDSKQQAFRPPKVSSENDSDVRIHGWEAAPVTPKPAPAPGKGWTLGNWGLFDGGWSVIVWVVLGIGLLLLAVLLAMTSVKGWRQTQRLSKKANVIAIDPTRVVDLPFEAREEMLDPLQAARNMAEAGDYDGAVQFLYGYMLLALDRAGQIVLHRGKTNRMYMFELSGARTLRDLLQPAMLAFEDVFFGRHSIDRTRFTKLWNNLDQFHAELAPVMQGRQPTSEVASV